MSVNETQFPIKEFTDENFTNFLQKLQFISDPLADLASTPMATVIFRNPCCHLRCGCPTCFDFGCGGCKCNRTYRYETLIGVGNNQKYFSTDYGTLNCMGVTKSCRFVRCSNVKYPSYNDYSSETGSEFAEMVPDGGCTFLGLCASLFNVKLLSNNSLCGIVKYRGCCEECFGCADCCNLGCRCNCCYNYYYCCEIQNVLKKTIYYIYIKKYCIDWGCTQCFGEINFEIKAPGGKTVGKIYGRRKCCSIYGICPSDYIYTIIFPPDATPEIKLTIINAVISIDLFYL